MKLTIALRIILMIGMSAVVALVVGLAGLASSASLSEALSKVQTDTLPSVETLYRVQAQTLRLRVHILNHALNTDQDALKKIEQSLNKSADVLKTELANYEKLADPGKDQELFAADKAATDAFLATLEPALEKSRNNENEEARKIITSVVIPASAKLSSAIDEHIKFLDKMAEERSLSAAEKEKRASFTSWTVIVVGLLLIVATGLLLLRSIRKSLHAMHVAITQIEHERDFRVRAPVHGHDELGNMARTLNRLIESMQTSLKQIYDSAGKVAQSSEHMAETAQQVAETSGQQSASASDMAAAIEQMTVSISHVGDRASEANLLSQDSGKLAKDGGRVIGQTVQDINEIATQVNNTSERIRVVEVETDKISSVVAVIRDVADQTNLLALNAAIEAARAGEQGRGFAVVADEVRKLAERTATSTHEIASMIEGVRGGAKDAVASMEQVVVRVNAGVMRAGDANRAIDQIGKTSEQAVEMVSEITSAIREQSAASTSIAQQVERIAQMAEESNAAASESASAAHELDKLAASMQQVVSAYKL
ncbi:methyl-accepting chemotaxis protein [Uliginosibacterium gangwonense]|uniref:methyl-accepting chemotaxis protein n=1 Tax=Uliginosibacterium gangwonense TaxID=392736 RepID=UPI0003807CFE|nr:methyl-accepting chemotaxis protein [Uliginosibacterium gangwonense]